MNYDIKFVGPINLGNPNEFNISELATKILKLTNSKSKIVYKQLPMDDPKQRQPNINLAKEFLEISVEHTHPPHELFFGEDRFKILSRLRDNWLN